MSDRFPLQRFVDAQDRGGVYAQAAEELRAGRKSSHWMWFIFPQIAGLGRSPMAQEYAISSREEAEAYLRHPVLGPRLLECARIVADGAEDDPQAIFGATDAMKLRSSMTLFAHAAPDEPVFRRVLNRCFGGAADPATQERL